MKWTKELHFHKVWSENNTFVSDNDIISYTLEQAHYYNLTIKEIELYDSIACTIRLRGTKKLYLNFVRDFVKHYKNHITNVSF